MIAKQLALNRSHVEWISGVTTAKNRFLIRGIAMPELARRIETALDG